MFRPRYTARYMAIEKPSTEYLNGISTMKIIDFHSHFYPPEYLDAIREGPSNVRVTIDAEGNPLLHYPGDYNIAVPGHRNIEYRTAVLDRLGIGMQVITLTTPGTHIEQPARAS